MSPLTELATELTELAELIAQSLKTLGAIILDPQILKERFARSNLNIPYGFNLNQAAQDTCMMAIK